jgi:hypothetical protein
VSTLHPDLEALMPEPVGFRSRYRSEPEMIGHYPWSWEGAGRRRRKYDRPECDYEDLFTADQVREAMQAATERAAKVCAAAEMSPVVDDQDRLFNYAVNYCAAAIRGTGGGA